MFLYLRSSFSDVGCLQESIKKPLILTSSKEVKKDAVECFRRIQAYMGDRKVIFFVFLCGYPVGKAVAATLRLSLALAFWRVAAVAGPTRDYAKHVRQTRNYT